MSDNPATRAWQVVRHPRSPIANFGWMLRDYAKRVWDNSGEDNVLFLAGGIAFNLLLAAVPFVLLLVTGVTYLLPKFVPNAGSGVEAVFAFLDRLLPAHQETPDAPIHKLLSDILRTRASVGIYSAIGFVWFSTRLFGSLRTVLAEVFDIENERSIIQGKLFDIKITVLATLLFVASTALTTYISIATTRGVHLLGAAGLRKDVMGELDAVAGRLIAFVLTTVMFFSIYKFLPVRRVKTRAAWIGALFTSVLFELAKSVFSSYVATFNPGSLYTGTLTAIIVVVVWVYYAALIFILGGEVGQVSELRRMRREQHEAFAGFD